MRKAKALDASAYFYLVSSMRTIFCIALCLVAANCATTTGAGQTRSDKVNEQLDSATADMNNAESLVDQSNATPEQKEKIKADIEAAKQKTQQQKPTVSQLGKDVDNNKKIADKAEAKAQEYTADHRLVLSLKILGGLAVAAAIGFGIKKVFF